MACRTDYIARYTFCYSSSNAFNYIWRYIVNDHVRRALWAHKTRVTRLRRRAERQGLELRKSRRRDPLAKDYGLYWVVDPDAEQANDPDWPFQGPGRPAHHFPWKGAELDEVEEFLATRPEDR